MSSYFSHPTTKRDGEDWRLKMLLSGLLKFLLLQKRAVLKSLPIILLDFCHNIEISGLVSDQAI